LQSLRKTQKLVIPFTVNRGTLRAEESLSLLRIHTKRDSSLRSE